MKAKIWNTLYSLKSGRKGVKDDLADIDSKPINGIVINCRGCGCERMSRKSIHDSVMGYRCIECGKFHPAN